MTRPFVVPALVLVLLLGLVTLARARQAAPGDAVRYVNGNHLVLPADYREWVAVGTGLGMTYEGEAQRPGRPPTFTNVFVNPASYRQFMASGRWPDRTVFILEFRAAESRGSINVAGQYQGRLTGIEAEVKDARLPDGWGFYLFGDVAAGARAAEPIADQTRCVECHTKHTAVERTFVQFYPTLLDAARKHGTLKPGF